MTTRFGPRSKMRFAASRIASTSEILCPDRTSASGMLGVTTSASGRSLVFSAPIASSFRRRAPLLATITGSTTRFGTRWRLSAAATASRILVLDSMPVLAASMPMSSATASICAATTSASISWMRVTARVFCAVMAVIAEVPNTPSAPNVLRSAWMPAPPPESDPAMVRARFIEADYIERAPGEHPWGSPAAAPSAPETISRRRPGGSGRPARLRDHALQGARGRGDVLGRDDGRNDRRTRCPGLEDPGDVFDVDPSDGDDRDGDRRGDLRKHLQSQGIARARLGRGPEHRADAHVVGALLLRALRLILGAGGDADQAGLGQKMSRLPGRQVHLAEMRAVGPGDQGHIHPVVHQKGGAEFPGERLDFGRDAT